MLAEIKQFPCNCKCKVNAYKIIQIESYMKMKFITLHENVEYFNYLGSLLTDDAGGTCEIKSRISTSEAAFNNKNTLFTCKLDLNLCKKLVKRYTWRTALYGSETWTLREIALTVLK
jgi:hypothetical protein